MVRAPGLEPVEEKPQKIKDLDNCYTVECSMFV
jgi:hypothetical protein